MHRQRLALALVLAAALAAALSLSAFTRGAHPRRPPAARAAPRRPHPRTHPRRRARPPLRPPQFLVVSFDGSGGVRLWPYWRRIARSAGARFTFFVSGVYLLDWAHRSVYHPPRHAAGASDIGFAWSEGGRPPSALVRGMLGEIAAAYREGHEIGTHFNGHFCAPSPGNVGEWSAADWRSELDQFDRLLFDASANEGLRPRVSLPFGPSEIVGDRTPCLQGDPRALLPVLAERGFRYDASQQRVLGTWPWRELGVWELPLLEIPFVGHTYRVVSMDYNFFVNETLAGLSPREAEAQTYASLRRAFRTSYFGNRAPLSFANHFETWDAGAYDHALARVVLRACRLPEVRCVSFRELATWLDAQPRARLRRYRLGRFPRLPPPVHRR